MGIPLLFATFKKTIAQQAWNWDRIKNRPEWQRILVPLVLAGIVTWLLQHPFNYITQHAPFLFYFGVLFLSACFGGSRSAFYATWIAAICVAIFIMPQRAEGGGSSFFSVAILFFVIEALFVTGLISVIEIVISRYQSSEETYRGIVENNAEGFFMVNQEGDITYVCSSVQSILGYDERELKGVNLHTLIHPEEEKKFSIKFLKILTHAGESTTFLQRIRSKDGEWQWIEGCVNNMLKDSRIKSILFQYRNVTERINKKKQQEDFIHMAAHELKTPITALRGFLQLVMLNHKKQGRTDDLHLFTRMNQQTDRLLNLIDEMLNVTRIRAGALQYHFDTFDLNECVQEAADAFHAGISSHRLNLFPAEVPKINGDKDRINQVITNLISNAVKYSPNADVVDIALSAEPGWVTVTVKDHGIGIPKDQQKKIFERFYRAESLPKNTYQGLGLGLYISMEIIKKHNGRMGVKSEHAQGSEFWFSLPVNA